MPFSFDMSLDVELLLVDAVVDELGDMELDEDDELGVLELGDELDEAVELGGADVSVDDELLLDDGGVAGIDGVVVLDELDDDGGVDGVVVVSLFCWQPTSAITAAAAAVMMKRFI